MSIVKETFPLQDSLESKIQQLEQENIRLKQVLELIYYEGLDTDDNCTNKWFEIVRKELKKKDKQENKELRKQLKTTPSSPTNLKMDLRDI